MIAVDTNIVVRFLTRDDEPQFQKALALFESQDIFIPDTVVLETECVLRYAYDFEPVAIYGAFTKLFGLPNVHLFNPTIVALAIQGHIQGLDLDDTFHLNQCQQYNQFNTFE